MGKPNSADCLTLNITSGQWERGVFINGLLGEGVRGVINMEGLGVFQVPMEKFASFCQRCGRCRTWIHLFCLSAGWTSSRL